MHPHRVTENFGDRLRRAMRTRGWTRKKLAEETGVNRDTLDSWLKRPDQLPNGRQLKTLAETVRLSPTWLLTGDGPEWLGRSRDDAALAADFRAAVADRMRGWSAVLPGPERLLEEALLESTARHQPDVQSEQKRIRQYLRAPLECVAQLGQAARQAVEYRNAIRRLPAESLELLELQDRYGVQEGHRVFNDRRRCPACGCL